MEGIGGDIIEAGLESQTNKFVTIDNIVCLCKYICTQIHNKGRG